MKLDYLSLVTSNKRRETEEDHRELRKLMQRWPEIRDACRDPYESIKERQFARIKQLVTHAFKNVPMYTEKYCDAGFEPGDLKTWKDFEGLPIMEKDELIEAFPDKSLSKLHDMKFTTRSSGSSGKFATIVVSPNAIYEDTVQGARQFFFQTGGKYCPDDVVLFIYTSPWWTSSIDSKYKTEFLPTTTTSEEASRALKLIKPKILSLYPSYLKKMAGDGVDIKLNGTELIVIHSEQSYRKERDALSKVFGIPILDEYSSEELTRIALECPSRNYHLEEDACYIEIVDTSTRKRLPNGKEGLVIGTNLLNEAMPIIRYNQGDLVSMIGAIDCECGSNFRVIGQPKGRVMDCITTPDGEIIPSGSFMDLAYNWYLEMNVPVHGLRYQIKQDASGSVKVKIVPGRYSLNADHIKRIKASMYNLLPDNMYVTVDLVKDIPPIGNKFRPVISRYSGGLK